MGKIGTLEFGLEVGIWLKCLLAEVVRKYLATMTYDTILYGGYSEPCNTPMKGAPFQKNVNILSQFL